MVFSLKILRAAASDPLSFPWSSGYARTSRNKSLPALAIWSFLATMSLLYHRGIDDGSLVQYRRCCACILEVTHAKKRQCCFACLI